MTATGQHERVLAERVRNRDQGILQVNDGKVRRLFAVRNGELIHAASNIIEEQFEEFLIRSKKLDSSDFGSAKLQAAREKIPFLDWLVRQNMVSEEDLAATAAEHAGGLLVEAMTAASPTVEFIVGTPNLEGRRLTTVPLDRLLLRVLDVHPADGHLRSRVGTPDTLPLQAPDLCDLIHDLAEARPILLQAWEHCQGALNVTQIVRRIDAPEGSAWRALYALTLLGAVASITEADRAGKRAADLPVTRPELVARLDKAIGADHYDVLELTNAASAEQIRDAYYLLARRYHPDRFRSGELMELIPRIEAFFAQVTEAYNTLNEPKLRKAYDAELTAAGASSSEPAHDAQYLARQNYLRSKVLLKRKQFQQAVKFLENALELQPDVPEYLLELGTVLARNPRRRDEAERHLRRGLELNPTLVDGYLALFDVLMKRNREDEALRVLEQAQNWFPDHPEILKRAPAKGRGLFWR